MGAANMFLSIVFMLAINWTENTGSALVPVKRSCGRPAGEQTASAVASAKRFSGLAAGGQDKNTSVNVPSIHGFDGVFISITIIAAGHVSFL